MDKGEKKSKPITFTPLEASIIKQRIAYAYFLDRQERLLAQVKKEGK